MMSLTTFSCIVRATQTESRRIQLKINRLMQQHRASNAIDLMRSLNAKADPQDVAFLIECNYY